MKAEDIREKKPYKSGSPGVMYQPNVLTDRDCRVFAGEMLRECAAQMAEANESLKYIAHPLVEVQSPEQAAGEKTLRDEFAMAVLHGMLGFGWDKRSSEAYAKEAYKIADSMLEARKK